MPGMHAISQEPPVGPALIAPALVQLGE